MVPGQDPEDLYQGDRGVEIGIWSVLGPWHGQGETSELEEPRPAEGACVEEGPRRAGEACSGSAPSHRMRSPHQQMVPLNLWTRVWDGVLHRTDESIVQCGVGRERRPQRDHWGRDGMECPPPLYPMSHLR